MKKNQPQMNKAQRDYLRIKLAEASRRLSHQYGEYLQGNQPKEVAEALDIIQTWDDAKSSARATFDAELEVFNRRAKEAILFGTKEEFDREFCAMEDLHMPAIMVEWVKRGKR